MYELTIIGAGWAGFNAALKAKENNLKVCLIEKSHIGGTCLNLGCIPTKTLIQSAKIYSSVKKSAVFGVDLTNPPGINFLKVQERKERIIEQLRSGMQLSLKGVDVVAGEAKFLSSQEIGVGETNIQTKKTLIACGSQPFELPGLEFDGQKIISSDDILALKVVPASLLIIGGGVIGCEFACLFAVLGSQVAIVEKMPQILPGVDSEVAKRITTSLKKKGIKIHTNTDALSFERSGFEKVLVCVGRKACVDTLGLEKIGLGVERGKIAVDRFLKTNIDTIYAAGDCTGKLMLAHYAAYQGRLAVNNMLQPDNQQEENAQGVPNCIFTDPEIASVGITEDEAIARNIPVEIHKFDFLGSGMARIIEETEGFIKIISEKSSGTLIGASIMGPRATELIGILTLALTNRLSVQDVKKTIFAHPTLSEAIHEAL